MALVPAQVPRRARSRRVPVADLQQPPPLLQDGYHQTQEVPVADLQQPPPLLEDAYHQTQEALNTFIEEEFTKLHQLLSRTALPRQASSPQKMQQFHAAVMQQINDCMVNYKTIKTNWADIVGLQDTKRAILRLVTGPFVHPRAFGKTWQNILLCGARGTSKHMLARALARSLKANLFQISTSSLANNRCSELIRALFAFARCKQPSVIFLSNIDLLLYKNAKHECEWNKVGKEQFVTEMQGIKVDNNQILLIGATHKPEELDEEAERRFGTKLQIPLHSKVERTYMIQKLLEKEGQTISIDDIEIVACSTKGYSGFHLTSLVKKAVMGPVWEEMQRTPDVAKLDLPNLRVVNIQDFITAMH